MELIVATGNEGKMKEIQEILAVSIPDATVSSLKDLFDPIPDIPETADSFEGNAFQKATWLHTRFPRSWVLADDSGLAVDTLDGAPGIVSARYAGTPSDSLKNMDKLLAALVNTPPENRTARFHCVMVLLSPQGKQYTCHGECEGTIRSEISGTQGFGYDPLFVPIGYSKTFAELGKEIKNSISHRAKALHQLSALLQELDIRKHQ